MNMQESNKYFWPSFLLALVILLSACQKEKMYVYDVNPVEVGSPTSNKKNIKTDQEFISIAYTDLFGTTISTDKLESLVLCYRAFGDKNVIIDMGIRNFLNASGVQVPTSAQMRSDPSDFVNDCYNKFYVRDPNEFEKWFMVDQIQKDTTLSALLMYYSFMTSEEYRYY